MTTIDGTRMIPFSPITRPAGSGSSSAHAAGSPSRPASPTAATVASAASGQPKMSGQPATSGPTCAQSVASRSQNHRSATAPATAESDARSGQPSGDTGSDKSSPGNGSVVPPNSRSFVVPPTVGTCGHCGAELKRKTRGGRVPTYCSSRCRVAAWRARRKTAHVAALVLVLLLAMLTGTAVHAQDGPTQQQQDVNTSQGQDVIINQSCEQGAVCNQQATVGGQEPAAPLQANSSAPAVATVEPVAADPCGPRLKLDTFSGECYDPTLEPSWGDVWAVFASAVVIGVGIILMWATRPKSW